MSNRLITLGLLTFILVILWAAGVFVWKHLADQIPPERRWRVAGAWVVLFTLIPFARMWSETYLTDRQPTYWKELIGSWPFYSTVIVGWLWSVLSRRRTRVQANTNRPDAEATKSSL